MLLKDHCARTAFSRPRKNLWRIIRKVRRQRTQRLRDAWASAWDAASRLKMFVAAAAIRYPEANEWTRGDNTVHFVEARADELRNCRFSGPTGRTHFSE
eukprot:s2906_g3.t1